MTSPLVSVLIPAYNAERWIGDAIESALSQTWARLEVVVVDDGSTDGTLVAASRLESKGVRIVTQENRGASAARNTALRYAQGEYIQWLDADDLLAPNKIASQLRDAQNGANSKVLLSGPCAEFSIRPQDAKFSPNPLWRDLEPIEFLLGRFTRNLWMASCSWLVSRKLTDLAGGWDERLSLDDDGEYFARIVSLCERLRFVPEARTYYRRASVVSLSRSVSERACESLLLSLRLCIGYLRALEDSRRTKEASLKFLQTNVDLSDCFYPDRGELFERVCALARELGGELAPPRLSWKYQPLRTAFGWAAVRQLKGIVANTKLRARLEHDRLIASVKHGRL